VSPPAGADGDPRAPIINVKNVDDGHLAPTGWGGGDSGPHPGFEICVVNLHRHDRQKVILFTCLFSLHLVLLWLTILSRLQGMGNSVRCYLGYDYDLV
jgi:hypothetical protein